MCSSELKPSNKLPKKLARQVILVVGARLEKMSCKSRKVKMKYMKVVSTEGRYSRKNREKSPNPHHLSLRKKLAHCLKNMRLAEKVSALFLLEKETLAVYRMADIK